MLAVADAAWVATAVVGIRLVLLLLVDQKEGLVGMGVAVAKAAVVIGGDELSHADCGPLTVVVNVDSVEVAAEKCGVAVATLSQRLEANLIAPEQVVSLRRRFECRRRLTSDSWWRASFRKHRFERVDPLRTQADASDVERRTSTRL
jgi:hypothetical protein